MLVRDILPWNAGRPVGIYYRPKVIYNPFTKLYVLWINRVQRTDPIGEPNFLDASYVVATSLMSDGQFIVVNTKVEKFVYRKS